MYHEVLWYMARYQQARAYLQSTSHYAQHTKVKWLEVGSIVDLLTCAVQSLFVPLLLSYIFIKVRRPKQTPAENHVVGELPVPELIKTEADTLEWKGVGCREGGAPQKK